MKAFLLHLHLFSRSSSVLYMLFTHHKSDVTVIKQYSIIRLYCAMSSGTGPHHSTTPLYLPRRAPDATSLPQRPTLTIKVDHSR